MDITAVPMHQNTVFTQHSTKQHNTTTTHCKPMHQFITFPLQPSFLSADPTAKDYFCCPSSGLSGSSVYRKFFYFSAFS